MRATYAGLLTIAIVASWQVETEAAEAPADPTLLQRGQVVARAVNVEATVRTSVVNVIKLRTMTQQVPQAKIDCVNKADVSFAHDLFAAAIAKTLTPDELNQAATFYGSPAGNLDSTKISALVAAARDPKTYESLSAEDKDNLDALVEFAPTSAYKKLESGAYSTPEFKKTLMAAYEPLVMACIAGPGAPAANVGAPGSQSMKFKHKCTRPAPDTLAASPSGEKPKTTAPRTNIKYPPTSPNIPKGAMNVGERRTVVLELFVTEKGRIAEARVAESSGHSVVDQAAMKVTDNWRMTPGTINDEDVCMWMKFVTTAMEDGG